MIYPNQPAFPLVTQPDSRGTYGMTLRDYFAAASIPTAYAHVKTDGGEVTFGEDPFDAHYIASIAYSIADQMLRVKKGDSAFSPHDSEAAVPPIDSPSIDVEVLNLVRELGEATHQKIAAAFRTRGLAKQAAEASKRLCKQGFLERRLILHPEHQTGFWIFKPNAHGSET